MLWNLKEEYAGKYFRAWSTGVRLAWNLPRSTHTYLVEGYLAGKERSLRNQIMGRVPGFLRSLKDSISMEVRFLFHISMKDGNSVTRINKELVQELSGRNPMEWANFIVRESLPINDIPVKELWRVDILRTLLEMRKLIGINNENPDRLQTTIDLICSV